MSTDKLYENLGFIRAKIESILGAIEKLEVSQKELLDKEIISVRKEIREIEERLKVLENDKIFVSVEEKIITDKQEKKKKKTIWIIRGIWAVVAIVLSALLRVLFEVMNIAKYFGGTKGR